MDLANSYYLWLVPDQENHNKFQKIIKDLSIRYNTPCFDPHVTLLSGLSAPEDALCNTIATIASANTPQTLSFDSIEYTHGFFTALYLKAVLTPELTRMNQQADTLLQPFGQKEYMPHMSLLYGNISEEEKKIIINKLEPLQFTIRFTNLKLVKGHSDVTAWKTINRWKLSE